MTRVAHYALLERIGAGGMGEVYRARDTRLGRTVAIKMLPDVLAADPERRDRFVEEARATAALSHPSIAMLFEIGEADGRLFLAFEFVPGQTLARALADGPMHPRRAVPLAIQIADALAEAHAAGIIHRDIKPENVIVTPKGSAKVLDFGLASWTEGGAARESAFTRVETDPSLIVGTLAYMSPEQARAQPLEGRSDIFSLGIVLYEMLTGRNPFAAPTAAATLVNVLQLEPPPPSFANSQVRPELDAIVMRTLAKDPAARYPGAAALASELRGVSGERTEHVFDRDAPVLLAREPRSRRWLPPVAALLFVAVLAGIGYPRRAELAGWWKRNVGSPPEPLIAVIPLDEIGESEHVFADGLTDDVIMRLGQTPGLRVLGRSSTRSYRGRAASEVARELGAAVVLTGSVQRERGDLKVNLELIDPSDGIQIWRRQFVRTATDVLAMQSEIADSVAAALQLELAASATRTRTSARTVSPEAYETYTRARAAAAARDQDRAISLYEEAIRADPGLAEAHAGLASIIYHRAAFTGEGFSGAEEARMREAAMRAAAIEPDLPEVEIAVGLTAPTLRESLEHMVRAIALDPSHADAHHELGDQLAGFAPARALRTFQRSRALDPQLFANYPDETLLNLEMGRIAAAGDVVRETRRVFPDSPFLLSLEALFVNAAGDSARAMSLQEQFLAGPVAPRGAWLNLARLYLKAGRRADAERTLNAGLRRFPGYCEGEAVAAGLLADRGHRREAQRASETIRQRAPLRCAVTASAAIGDVATAAAMLRRIAADERELREWLVAQFGSTGDSALEARLYPWQKVADAPAIVAARQEIRAAIERLQPVINDALRSLPQESR
jgi:non-specific serine/threonine protein kinase